jgi:hypothetical protein
VRVEGQRTHLRGHEAPEGIRSTVNVNDSTSEKKGEQVSAHEVELSLFE